jgi:hypothetical protein
MFMQAVMGRLALPRYAPHCGGGSRVKRLMADGFDWSEVFARKQVNSKGL